jgi:hypothetical protein
VRGALAGPLAYAGVEPVQAHGVNDARDKGNNAYDRQQHNHDRADGHARPITAIVRQ